MLSLKPLMPNCLKHNPNWVYFYNSANYIWSDNVVKHLPKVTNDDSANSETATREDILLRASRFGWTFADNFSANWADDERAERFLKRFIDSWIPYCRSYSGTQSLATYMGYLLGMEIRIVQLWSNEFDEWDTKPLPKVFRIDTQQLPDDYLVRSTAEEPFSAGYGETVPVLMSPNELNNKSPGWKTIDKDPVGGWYPTSFYDVYVDLEQVPKSDLQEKTAEDIISSLFYELADMCQVLRAIVYSYGFTTVVRVASGQAIVERTEANMWQMPQVDWTGWTIGTNIPVVGRMATYLGTNTNTQITYESTAQIDLGNALLKSLSDSDMQQWQGAKDAIGQLTGASSWTFDNAAKIVRHAVSNPDINAVASTLTQRYSRSPSDFVGKGAFTALIEGIGWMMDEEGQITKQIDTSNEPAYSPHHEYVYHFSFTDFGSSPEQVLASYSARNTINGYQAIGQNCSGQGTPEGSCSVVYITPSGSVTNGGFGWFRIPNPNYDPNATPQLEVLTKDQIADGVREALLNNNAMQAAIDGAIAAAYTYDVIGFNELYDSLTITYQQVVDKIISNSNAADQGISLLAQAYMQEVAKSILNPSPAKQFVTMADIESILELNKQLV